MPDKPAAVTSGTGLGAIAVLFGIMLMAWHANEWLKFLVVAEPPYTIATMPEPDCDEDELIEEGLSAVECSQLAHVVQNISISSPQWFKSFHIAVSAAGTVLAGMSIFAGIALVDARPWSGTLAVGTFAALAALDAISFAAVVNTGPLIRQMYLWSILLWSFIHLAMAIAAAARLQDSRTDQDPPNA